MSARDEQERVESIRLRRDSAKRTVKDRLVEAICIRWSHKFMRMDTLVC